MKRENHVILFGLSVIVAVFLAVTGVRSQTTALEEDTLALRSSLGSVPEPDLTNLDDTVIHQLRQARSELEETLAGTDVSAKTLAGAYGELGKAYHAYEFFAEARASYLNASRMQPDNYVWWHLLGDVSRRQGKLEDAIIEFEGALSLKPDDFAALVYMGDMQFELNRDAEAESVYRRALVLYPGSPSVMAGLGQLALRRQEYDDAVVFLKAALISVPDANRLHYSLAMAYRGLGRMDEARKHLEMRGTVGLRPPDPLVTELRVLSEGERVHLIRGRMAFAAGRYDEALAEFEKAVAADPVSVRALINLGTTLFKLGLTDQAMTRFREALLFDDSNLTAHFNLAQILASQGDPQGALDHVRKVVAESPNDSEARLLLAQTLVAVGDDEGSLEHFRESATLDPASEISVVEGAAALVRLGLYSRAKRVLEAGLDRLAESGNIAFALGRLLAVCPDEAERDGARALELALLVFEADSSPRHAQLVAQALAEDGQCDTAAIWQQGLVDGAGRDGAPGAAEVLRVDLEFYRNGPPCRPPGLTESNQLSK